MRIRTTVPPDLVNERTLGAAAESSTEVSQAYIERGGVPPLADAIEHGLVRWKPEDSPPGDESFDHPGLVLARGWGDCDDLAPWWAAELRASDTDPEARAIAYQSGPQRWHVVVMRGDGSIDDPSRWAGMGRKEGTRPAVAKPMATHGEDAVVGFSRTRSGIWKARLDVPTSTDGRCGVAIERPGLDPWDALTRAVGDISLAIMSHWGAPDAVIAKMVACNNILHYGVHPDADYTPMGPFVSNLAKAVGELQMSVDPGQAANLAATIVDPLGLRNLIPGLAQAFVSNYASSLAQRGGAKQQPSSIGAWGSSGYHPGAPLQTRPTPQASKRSRAAHTPADDGSQQQQQQQQDYCDPQTGLCFNAQTGQWYYPQQQQQPGYGGGYPQYPSYGGYPGYYDPDYGGGGYGPLYPY